MIFVSYGKNQRPSADLCVAKLVYPFSKQQTKNFKLKEFADDNFRFDEIGKKFSKRVENTMGKGEIARYEQFLLFL